MKYTLTIALWLVYSGVLAQTDTSLSPKMAVFKDYCIRVANAAGECNTDILIDCIDNWTPEERDINGNIINPEKFIYHKETINYIPFGNLELVDTLQEVSPQGHFAFLPAEVDSWIANKCEAVAIADAHILRAEVNHCEYTIRALKQGGKAIYSSRGAGKMEMFVVAEHNAKIRFTIHAEEINFKKEVIKEIDLTFPSEGQAAQLSWLMAHNGTVVFSIENLTDRDISYIIVKKL